MKYFYIFIFPPQTCKLQREPGSFQGDLRIHQNSPEFTWKHQFMAPFLSMTFPNSRLVFDYSEFSSRSQCVHLPVLHHKAAASLQLPGEIKACKFFYPSFQWIADGWKWQTWRQKEKPNPTESEKSDDSSKPKGRGMKEICRHILL